MVVFEDAVIERQHRWIKVNANAETPFFPPFPSLLYLGFAGRSDRGSGSPCGMLYAHPGVRGFLEMGCSRGVLSPLMHCVL